MFGPSDRSVGTSCVLWNLDACCSHQWWKFARNLKTSLAWRHIDMRLQMPEFCTGIQITKYWSVSRIEDVGIRWNSNCHNPIRTELQNSFRAQLLVLQVNNCWSQKGISVKLNLVCDKTCRDSQLVRVVSKYSFRQLYREHQVNPQSVPALRPALGILTHELTVIHLLFHSLFKQVLKHLLRVAILEIRIRWLQAQSSISMRIFWRTHAPLMWARKWSFRVVQYLLDEQQGLRAWRMKLLIGGKRSGSWNTDLLNLLALEQCCF
jgi:hypothetical protein